MKVRNKVFVVTGAGGGMGRELTWELLRRGASVAAVDLRPEALARTAELAPIPEALSTHVVDITDRAAVEALPDAVIRRHGGVDGLINNAGIIQPFVPIAELDYPTMERVLGVNFWGTVHMVKAFLPLLSQRPEAHIADVSSMGGFLPVPGQAIYGASKAAVKLMTEALYAELLDTRVGVSVVLPGGLGTDITRNSGVEMPAMDSEATAKASARTTAADAAARTVLDGIEAGKYQIMVGRDAQVMDLAVRVDPKRATHLIRRQMRHLLV